MRKQHTFYKTFYLLNGARGRLNRDSALRSRFQDEVPIIYSRNDLFGALCRDQIGGWALPMRSRNQGRESAFRFGVNLLMYATCLNYKRDQVHVPPYSSDGSGAWSNTGMLHTFFDPNGQYHRAEFAFTSGWLNGHWALLFLEFNRGALLVLEKYSRGALMDPVDAPHSSLWGSWLFSGRCARIECST